MRKARRWERTPSKRSVLDTLLDKVMREMWPRSERRPARRRGAPAKPRHQDFALEQIEPRLLMSADIFFAGGTDHAFTLQAAKPSSDYLLQLVDDALLGNAQHGVIATADLTTLGRTNISIQRSDATNDTSGDTLSFNLDTFFTLDNLSALHSGGTLSLNFTSSDQPNDLITLDTPTASPTTPASLGYGLTVQSDSKITSSASLSVAGNLSLTSKDDLSVTAGLDSAAVANANTGITLTNANLTTTNGGSITLDAHSHLDVTPFSLAGGIADATNVTNSKIKGFLDNNLGTLNENNLALVISFDSATIDIGGTGGTTGTTLNSAGDLNISSTVDGSLAAVATSNLATVAVTVGSADPEVLIGGNGSGTNLTAGGQIDAAATSNLSVTTTGTPNLLAKLDPTVDGAVAVTVFDSQAVFGFSNSASLDATGATSLTANSTLDATTFGNSSGGGAGAGVAVAVVYGDTTASIDSGTVTGSSVTLASNSTRTLTTVANSSIGGSSASGGGMNASEKTLANNNATTADNTSTGDNSVSVAGAVAVNVDTGTTSAYINSSTITATGDTTGVVVMTTPVDTVFVAASGASTGSTTNSVGVGVAIDVADRTNLAYVSGPTSITTNSLTILVGALDSNGMPDSGSLGLSTFSASAISGIGEPSAVGVAGALAVNVVVTDDEAYIASGAKLTLPTAADVAIEADSNVLTLASAAPTGAGGSDKSSVGVGISIAFAYGQNTTAAYIGDTAEIGGAGGAQGLTLTANSSQDTATSAENGGKGVTAVTPVIAISVADNTASATIGSGVTALDGTTALTIGSDGFTASSSLNDSVQTTATGDTTSSSTGVGISIALSIVNDSSLATTNSNLVSGGAAAFLSSAISGSQSTASASAAGGEDDSTQKNEDSSNQSVDQKTQNQKSFANSTAKADETKVGGSAEGTDPKGTGADKSSSASSSEGSVSVAAAVAVNIENGSSEAYVPAGLTITSTGTLTVQSDANIDGHAQADGSASTSGSGVSVGLAVPINVNRITNLAYVANTATISSGGLLVSTGMADRQVGAAPVIEHVVELDASTANIPTDSANSPVLGNDTIYVGADKLKTGDKVLYNPASAGVLGYTLALAGTAIGGLTNGDSYYVYESGGTIYLYKSQADALAHDYNYVTLTSLSGTGDVQAFAKWVSGVPDPNPANWVYFNPNGVLMPQVVTADSAAAYTVANLTDPTFAVEPTFRTDSIFLGLNVTFNSGFNTALKSGAEVLYNPAPLDGNGGLPLATVDSLGVNSFGVPDGALIPEGTYYVNVDDHGTIRLYGDGTPDNSKAQADAAAGNPDYIKFAPTSSLNGTEQEFFKYVAVPATGQMAPNLLSPITFDPSGQVTLVNIGGSNSAITLGALGNFRTGDPVTYTVSNGGAPFTGLDGTGATTYYAIDLAGTGYYQLAATRDDAIAGKAIAISGATGADFNAVVDDNVHSDYAAATAGAGGGDIGVGASVAINVVNNDTEAVVGKGGAASVTITGSGDVANGSGDVSVTADSEAVNFTIAKPAQGATDGSKVGVGGSVAVAVIDNTVNAAITDGTSIDNTIGSLTVSATDGDSAYTHGENGATASGGVAVGIGVAVAVIQDTVTAYVGTGSAIAGTGDVNITAALNADLETTTSAAAAGSSVGVGASISVDVVIDNVSAEVARDISTDFNETGSTGVFNLISTSTVTDAAQAIATVKGVDPNKTDSTSSSDSSKSGADGQADHQINDNSTVTDNKGSADTSLPSASSTDSTEGGKGSANSGESSGGVGVAAAVSVNVLIAHNTASVTSATIDAQGGAVTIAAEAQDSASAKGIGAAIAMNNKTNIGAGVGLNVVTATNEAFVVGAADATSEVKGNGVTIEAITPATTTDAFTVWGAAGAGGKNLAVAGSVGINVVSLTTDAYTDSNTSVESAGDLTVKATALVAPQDLVAAGAFASSGSGIGASVAVNVFTLDTSAHIDGSADASGALLVDAENHFAPAPIALPFLPSSADPTATAIVVAGAAGSNVAVAGAVIVDDFMLDATADIGANALINQGNLYTATAGQTVTVGATNDTTVTTIAGSLGLSKGAAGIGGSLDVEIISKTTDAYIDAGATVDAGGLVSVTATSTETLLSVVATAGISTGQVGIGGAVDVAVVTPTTDAYIGPGATINAGTAGPGGVTIAASDTFSTIMIAGAVGAAGEAGIGVSNTTLVLTPTVEAYIDSSALDPTIVTAAGTVSVGAQASESIISIAAGIGGGGTVGVAGSAAVNVLDDTTKAYVGADATITTTTTDLTNSPSNLSVSASDDTSVISVAGSLAGGGSVGAGVGADVGVYTKDTEAYLGVGVDATIGGNILIDAESSESLISVSAGIGVGGDAGVAANAGVHVFGLKTLAYIDSSQTDPSMIHADGSIVLAANDYSNINEIVGVLAAGGYAGVGAAVGVDVFTPDTEAYISPYANVTALGNGAGLTVDTGGISIGQAASTSSFDPGNPSANGGVGIETNDPNTMSNAESGNRASLQSQGQVGTPSLGGMDLSGNGKNTDMSTEDPSLSGVRTAGLATDTGFHGLAVTASNRDEVRTFTVSLAGGLVGVAVSAGVDVSNATTKAYIGDNATINGDTTLADPAQSVLVGAGSDFYHLSVAGTLAGGAVGVAPAVGVNVITNKTEASIGASATVNALGDIAVAATASEDVVMIGFGVAAGGVGVGGAVDVLSIDNTTTAGIGDFATIYAGGNVFVDANDDTQVFELSGAIGAGAAAGIGGSIGVMLITKDTEATIGASATVDALGVSTIGIADVLDGGITSGSPDTFDTIAAHGVIVQAQSSEHILHIVAAAGVGYVGVSGAVGVTLINSTTLAEIYGSANINTLHPGLASTLQAVYVNAGNDTNVQTFMIGIAGGFVGVAGAVDVGVLNNTTTAQVDSGATLDARGNIAVDAVALKHISGFDASGSGGVVGIGGAVSVWSIGTQIKKSTTDKNGKDTGSALDSNGNSADSNAGDQAQSGSGMVSTGLGNFTGDTSGNSNTSQNRVNSATGDVSTDVSNSAPTSAAVSSMENTAAPPAGTSAVMDGTAHAGAYSGLQTGDRVTYNPDGNTAIGNLSHSGTYYARVQNDGTVQLYDTEAHALAGGSTGLVSLTSQGAGDRQNFTFSPSIHFNPSANGVVNTTNDTINLGSSNLANGAAVTYDASTGSPIGGLIGGRQYYVHSTGGGNYQLYDDSADAIAGTASDTVSFNQSTAVDTNANTINIGTTSGLVTGEGVTYHVAAGGTAIGGLSDGGVYYANISAGLLKLYDTKADALLGGMTGLKDLTSKVGTSQQDTFTAGAINLYSTGSGTDQKFVTSTTTTLEFNPLGVTVDDHPIVNTTNDTIFLGSGIGVNANDEATISVIGGQLSGGVVGAGASVAILSVAENVSALADGSLSTVGALGGGTISVGATLNENVSLINIDGAVGFVGIGAAVAVVSDSSLVQASLGDVPSAGAVTVSAVANRTFSETTGQISVGEVAAGASFARVDVSGGSYASVDAGSTLSVASLTVSAASTIDANALTVAVSAGVGAFSANFSILDITPTVEAYINHGATVTASGAVLVLASSTIAAEADMYGVSAGGLAVGVSFAQVTVTPTVIAALGDPGDSTSGNVTITAPMLTVMAMTPLLNGNVNTAAARAIGSAGALVGITGTDAEVDDNTVVKSFVGDNSVLSVSGVTTIATLETTQNEANADANAGGIVAGGIAISIVASTSDTEAFFGSGVTLGTFGSSPTLEGGLVIAATSEDDNFADTNAGSGGAISGAAAVANTTNDSTTRAAVGAGSQVNLTGTFTLGAAHTAAFNEQITSLSGGLFAGAGAASTNEVTARTTASIDDSSSGAPTTISAAAIAITATDDAEKPQLTGDTPENVSGTTGGAVSVAGVTNSVTISFYTDVYVGSYADLATTGVVSDNPLLTLSASNTFNVYDQIAFTTGGALSGSGIYGSIEANGVGQGIDQAYVTVGNNATLYSPGMIAMAVNGGGSLDQEIASDTYGAGTVMLGQPTVDLRPDNKVEIGSGSVVKAYGDLNLLAGTDVNKNEDHYTITSRFDGFAGSAIPISDVHAVAYDFQSNQIVIDSGALVESARTANLLTALIGVETMTAQAKAESWVSDLSQALLGDGALLAYQNATAPSLTNSVITNDGIVETGINRHQVLTLGNPDVNNPGGWDTATGVITKFHATPGITFSTGKQSLSSAIVAQIATDQQIQAQYGSTNQTLYNYYAGQIAQLESELAADNLVDPVSGLPLNPFVMTVEIDPIFADAGPIFTQATQLEGSGQWIAPSDASVQITNYTPAFLHLFGITIPSDNGGLYYNGLEVSENTPTQVTTASENRFIYDQNNGFFLGFINKTLSGAGDPIPELTAVAPTYQAIPNPSTSTPTVVVSNAL
ncbi:MAG TPA: LEPR-XLL domain-containing protein, partial [Stellaceae bacterium]|nr:LEPR-XLL domain-containing protein [Stellaceae bacterium]